MDAKKRVTIPADWQPPKGAPADVFYILPTMDSRYLNAFPPNVFVALENEIRGKVPEEEWPDVRREVFGTARRISHDSQHRLLIPEDFCREVGIESDVVMIGVRQSFEIWDARTAPTKTKKSKVTEKSITKIKSSGL